ncbi:protein of unknown function [Micromonospora phaseoli]|uniref:DUF397 domain-containing protein n=1 Tax=Micromonospora phaseoli TaxID=1144548 RepID=A0A1H6S132_9ACTN|nr:DUF397 domain-containing protein [Micromonospora phaseoli]PZW03672.1 uncharacterized protein DUF397 [Micromonospora phaseoli]GIJ80344.1 hypothetical protein Xph01_47760 [Micromonospora phaseoli]SEI59554.1 protein of unknown function [Micromonospora phaseoli]
MTDLSGMTWRKASRSSDQGNCVEVADGLAGVVGVRDSKDVAGPALLFDAYQWRSFVQTLKSKRPA